MRQAGSGHYLLALLSVALEGGAQNHEERVRAALRRDHPPLAANRSCPTVPPQAKYDADAPRMFFIGAHRAGTTFHMCSWRVYTDVCAIGEAFACAHEGAWS